MDLDQQAKLKALQALKAQSGTPQVDPVQAAILARQQANKQRQSGFLQGQQEMDADTEQSQLLREEALRLHPELESNPSLNTMSGEQIRQLLQSQQEANPSAIPNDKQKKTFGSIRNAFGAK